MIEKQCVCHVLKVYTCINNMNRAKGLFKDSAKDTFAKIPFDYRAEIQISTKLIFISKFIYSLCGGSLMKQM